MAQIEHIKHLYECEGESLRETTKEVGVNFRKVQKYAYMNGFSPQVPPNVQSESYPVLGSHIPTVKKWMGQDIRELRKRRHTAKRIYDRLKQRRESVQPLVEDFFVWRKGNQYKVEPSSKTVKENHLKVYESLKYVMEKMIVHLDHLSTEYLAELLLWFTTLPEKCRMKIEKE